MPTEEQVERISVLLDETDLGRRDLSYKDESWAVYERVSPDDADEIIEWLVEQKDVMA